jgi:pyruvate,water dikinase
VRKAGGPSSVRDEVLAAYHRLGDTVPVAVRSSATGEDTAGTSFAGMHETFANVVGDASVIERLSDCLTSLYGERVITYRTARGIVDEPSIAVVVQVLVNADRAGVLFTADPSTGNRSNLVIEGAFGLGEVVVSGQVEVDTYTLSEDGPRLLQTRIGRKDHKIVSTENGGVERIDLNDDDAFRRVLTDDEAVELARLGLAVRAHYGGEPQDVEWATVGDQMYILQARPITSLCDESGAAPADVTAQRGHELVRGLAASAGIAVGPVRVLQSPHDGAQLVAGEVLVAPMTNPDWVPTMRRASACQ